jgi:hypothetical protein
METLMNFFKAMKTKVEETKQNVSDMNDRRKVSDLLDTLDSFPLCSESDAMYIVQSLLTKYIGRSHVATIDLEAASPEEFDREMAALDVVDEKIKDFLEIIFEEKFKDKVSMLTGSISVSFHSAILDFLGQTDTVVDKDVYEEILSVMIKEASGSDIALHFGSGSTSNIYDNHIRYKTEFFPNVFFRELEKDAEAKFQSYQRLSKDKPGRKTISAALGGDTIGSGRTMDLFDYTNYSWSKGVVGMASVPRMIEYYLPPQILAKKVVHSLRNLSVEMKREGDVHWHFCEDGILQLDLVTNARPRWIPISRVEKLTFGEGYNGLSKDGVNQFENFFLYMSVKTVTKDEFTLFKFLNEDRKKAVNKLTTVLNTTLPELADFYPVEISDHVYDNSKHYKTTYTTTYVWGEF